jgi:hypothetical protein
MEKQSASETSRSDKWFKIDSQSLFGFGTEREADTYTDLLNRNREININRYHATAMDPGDCAATFNVYRARLGQTFTDVLGHRSWPSKWPIEAAGPGACIL